MKYEKTWGMMLSKSGSLLVCNGRVLPFLMCFRVCW